MLEKIRSYSTDLKIKRFTADSGYESEENYTYLDGAGIEFYIKPQNYEQQKKRSFKKNISKRENITYNAETDEYTCHNGKLLKAVGTFKKKSSTGYISEVTVYKCESCEGCLCKEKCTKAKGNRRMEVSKTFLEKRRKSDKCNPAPFVNRKITKIIVNQNIPNKPQSRCFETSRNCRRRRSRCAVVRVEKSPALFHAFHSGISSGDIEV